MPENPAERIRALRAEILDHDERYYNQDAPTISDREYDALMEELRTLEAAHPDLVTPESPTQRVGAALPDAIADGEKVAHTIPMLSIGNAYDDADILRFCRRVEGECREHPAPVDYLVELKIDGLAISIRYEGSALRLAATRGDGRTGENVTGNVRMVEDIPHALPTAKKVPGLKTVPDTLEVRGEVYLPRGRFEALRREQEEQGADRVFANPRNAAAGTLKLKDKPDTVRARGLSAWIYATPTPEALGADTQADALDRLDRLGFPVNPHRRLCADAGAILAFRDEIDALRRTLPYDTDGLVIKVNHLGQQALLGSDAKSPRWALAYKFEPEQAETTLAGIHLQVGKSGVVTPVADLEPVFLSGSTITHASLHNVSYIEEKDIRIGDRVLVEKAGEIIPQVARSLPEKRSGAETPFPLPTACPSCSSPLEEEVSTKPDPDGTTRTIRRLFCRSAHCPAQKLERILHFCSRGAMDIRHLGTRNLEALIRAGLVESVADLYDLNEPTIRAALKDFRENSGDTDADADVDASSDAEDDALGGGDAAAVDDACCEAGTNRTEDDAAASGDGADTRGDGAVVPPAPAQAGRKRKGYARKSASAAGQSSLFGNPEPAATPDTPDATSSTKDDATRPASAPSAARPHELDTQNGGSEKPEDATNTDPADTDTERDDTNAARIRSSIAASRNAGLARLLTGLGIPHIGTTVAQQLAMRFQTMDRLQTCPFEELAAMPMGNATAYRTLGRTAARAIRKRLDKPDAQTHLRALPERPMLDRLEALAIPKVGRTRLEAVATAYPDADALLAAPETALAAIETGSSDVSRTLGEVAAGSLRAWLDDPENRALLDRLRRAGVEMGTESRTVEGVSGKTFVLTGTMEGLTRDEAARRIQEAGGLVGGSVTKKTDYLVAGEKAGSKLGKARALGIPILDRDDLLRLLGE